MDTIITEDKTVMPRVYQAYGDNISSKQAMEPLALAHGVGPVCGFDHLEYDSVYGILTIGSIYDENFRQSYTSEGYRLLCANHKQQTWLSDKNNKSGVVYNALISPSGLLHIAPRTITLEVPDSIKTNWPIKNTSGGYSRGIIVCLIANFEYKDSPSEYDDTSITWSLVSLSLEDLSTDTDNHNIYTYTLEDWQSNLAKKNLINHNTDCLIGVYMIGFSTSWVTGQSQSYYDGAITGLINTYSDILSKFNYILPLIPYGGKLTPFNTSNILGVPMLGDYPNNHLVVCSVEFDAREAVLGILKVYPELTVYSPGLTQIPRINWSSEISRGGGITLKYSDRGGIIRCKLAVNGQPVFGYDPLKVIIDENTLKANIEALFRDYPNPEIYTTGLPVIYLLNCYLNTSQSPSELIVNLYVPDTNIFQGEKWNVKLTVSFISKQPLL